MNRKVEELQINPFYVMPGSLRSTETAWKGRALFGRYTAVAKVAHGYENQADVITEKRITFWVIPWKVVVGGFAALTTLIALIVYVRRKFEIRSRS
jgi:hypothetical protein